MEKYKKLDSSFPERILKTFEMQVAHRHTLENIEMEQRAQEVKNSHKETIRGQNIGLVIIFLLITFATFCLFKGSSIGAIASVITAIGAVVGSAWLARKNK